MISIYNFIRVKIYKESIYFKKEFIGCLYFFNNDELKHNLNKELLYIKKEYGNISYEINK